MVVLLWGKQWEVKHRRGGMEGDEYLLLGLILLSGVAISVFWLSPQISCCLCGRCQTAWILFESDNLCDAILAGMQIYRRSCHGPGHITAGVESIKPFYLFALILTLLSFVFVQAFARRWKSVTAAGFDVRLSFLCGIHERFASRENAEWCKDKDYLPNRRNHKTAWVLPSGNEETRASQLPFTSTCISDWLCNSDLALQSFGFWVSCLDVMMSSIRNCVSLCNGSLSSCAEGACCGEAIIIRCLTG